MQNHEVMCIDTEHSYNPRKENQGENDGQGIVNRDEVIKSQGLYDCWKSVGNHK